MVGTGPAFPDFSIDRRALLTASGATVAAVAAVAAASIATAAPVSMRLIAVEEAWACPEWMEAMAALPVTSCSTPY